MAELIVATVEIDDSAAEIEAGNVERRLHNKEEGRSRIIQIEMMAEVVNGLVVRLLLLPLNKIMEVEADVEVVAVMVVVEEVHPLTLMVLLFLYLNLKTGGVQRRTLVLLL